MKATNQFITLEAAQHIDKSKFKLEKATVLPKNSTKFFEKNNNKTQTIHIYDLGFNNNQRLIPINNHINKTGFNPMCAHKKKNVVFYDITNIYQQTHNGGTAECFGLNVPNTTNQAYIPTRFLCHHTIAAYCAGFEKIFAYIID